jgi:hypothetical protein
MAYVIAEPCIGTKDTAAIFALDDLPEKWTEFTKKNADYFGR